MKRTPSKPSRSPIASIAGVFIAALALGAVFVAITALPQSSGSSSFGDGTQMLDELAHWVRQHVKVKDSRPAASCKS